MKRGMRVTFTTKGLMESLGASRRKVQKAREAFDVAVATELKRLAEEDFDKRSRGASGATGRKWKRLAPSTVQKKGSTIIGIDQGDLVNSLKVTVNNRGISATYAAPHAGYFDEERPLLPSSLPMTWERKLEEAGKKAVIRVLGQ
jgi:hypothetical protein